jgi:hypothetical protein
MERGVSSDRLRKVYESTEWRTKTRPAALERADWQCEVVHTNIFGETTRCDVVDRKHPARPPGAKVESLTVDHTDEYADPFDIDKLKVYCRRHHGMKDGARAAHRKETW